jgi:hypothetical protein
MRSADLIEQCPLSAEIVAKVEVTTTLVTDHQWHAFNATFCLSFDHAESVIAT